MTVTKLTAAKLTAAKLTAAKLTAAELTAAELTAAELTAAKLTRSTACPRDAFPGHMAKRLTTQSDTRYACWPTLPRMITTGHGAWCTQY
jgi:hypothetical protein